MGMAKQMLLETKDTCTLLYSKLLEGLWYSLIEAPAVSGATSYQSLCVAAKSEERRQAELKKYRQCKPDYQSSDDNGSGRKELSEAAGPNVTYHETYM